MQSSQRNEVIRSIVSEIGKLIKASDQAYEAAGGAETFPVEKNLESVRNTHPRDDDLPVLGFSMEHRYISKEVPYEYAVDVVRFAANRPYDLVIVDSLYAMKDIADRQVNGVVPAVIVANGEHATELRFTCKKSFFRQSEKMEPLVIDGRPDFVPKRIFIANSHYILKYVLDLKALFAWARRRYGVIPLIVGL